MPLSLAAVLPALSASTALAAYLALIAAAAFAGGSSMALLTLSHRMTQVLLSFTGGVLLGVGMLHLVPHAAMELRGDLDTTMGWALGGFFVMFLLERAFHAHAHHAADSGCSHEHAHHHHEHHGHHDHHHHDAPPARRSRWAWCGALAGLALHSLADGAALAASVGADAVHGGSPLPGFATFLAILLHKPLDAAIIATLMLEARASHRLRTLVNLGYAAVVPIGAAGFFASLSLFGGQEQLILGAALAVAGGAFICIAAADLLPEVQFHSHDRVLLTTALVLGLGLAWGITIVERGSHDHATHGHPAAPL
jgi:zinc and cadmium transporter